MVLVLGPRDETARVLLLCWDGVVCHSRICDGEKQYRGAKTSKCSHEDCIDELLGIMLSLADRMGLVIPPISSPVSREARTLPQCLSPRHDPHPDTQETRASSTQASTSRERRQ